MMTMQASFTTGKNQFTFRIFFTTKSLSITCCLVFIDKIMRDFAV